MSVPCKACQAGDLSAVHGCGIKLFGWRCPAADAVQTKGAIGVLLGQRLRAQLREPIGIIQVNFTVNAHDIMLWSRCELPLHTRGAVPATIALAELTPSVLT